MLTKRLILAALAVPSAVLSSAAEAQDYDLTWRTTDAGGVMFITGGSLELSGTGGQPDAGKPLTGGGFELTSGFWSLEVETLPVPEIVHGAPGVSFADHAFSGYVDPRCDTGIPPFCNMPNQIDRLNIVFNVEPFGDVLNGPVTPANFVITETGGGTPPNVIGATKTGKSVLVALDRVLTYGQWTTVEANVFNALGVAIQDLGNQGPGIDEPDRIDVGFLSGDIDQEGRALPLDNTRFRQIYGGTFHNPKGIDENYADITRDGSILPFDITVWRINYNGWLFAALPAQP